MTIQLRPEDEPIVRKRLDRGECSSADEVVHRALRALDEEDSWPSLNRETIHEKIERGLAELERGEGLTEAEVKARMEAGKKAWLVEHGR
jgi:putative addiction module CopG family antidote